MPFYRHTGLPRDSGIVQVDAEVIYTHIGGKVVTDITGISGFASDYASYSQYVNFQRGESSTRVMTGSRAIADGQLMVTPSLVVKMDALPATQSIRFTLLNTAILSGKYRFRETYRQVSSRNWGVNIDFIITDKTGKSFKGVALCANQYGNTYRYYDDSVYGENSKVLFTDGATYNIGFLDENVVNATSLSDINTYYHQFGSGGSIYDWDTIDFGSGQEVPDFVFNFINDNLDLIYPYTYAVKSQNGTKTLAERTETPPVKSVSVSYVENQKTLTLKGVNDIDYVLTWESEAPAGKTFLGLSYGANDTRASLAVGQTTPVTWDGNQTLYEVYATYRPPVTTFDMNLYQNSAEVNRVDKSDYLTGVGTLSGVLRQECSMMRPTVTFTSTSVPTFNYVYIAPFGRYYYVVSITSVSKNVWRMELNCDVLHTYRDKIRALTGVIGRQENDYNAYLNDPELPAQANQNITVTEFPAGGFNTADAIAYPFVLTVVGA